jgi:hypothetical protein
MERLSVHDRAAASILRGGQDAEGLDLKGRYLVECYGADGRLKWSDTIDNLITNVGKDHVLDVILSAGTQITTWYLGLMSSTPTAAAADTMSSHSGWTEVTDYSESVRQTFTDGGVSGQSISNTASKASYSINGTVTVGGAFLTSNSTKGGTTGTLFSAGAFSGGNKAVASGDTLQVTYTCTA